MSHVFAAIVTAVLVLMTSWSQVKVHALTLQDDLDLQDNLNQPLADEKDNSILDALTAAQIERVLTSEAFRDLTKTLRTRDDRQDNEGNKRRQPIVHPNPRQQDQQLLTESQTERSIDLLDLFKAIAKNQPQTSLDIRNQIADKSRDYPYLNFNENGEDSRDRLYSLFKSAGKQHGGLQQDQKLPVRSAMSKRARNTLMGARPPMGELCRMMGLRRC